MSGVLARHIAWRYVQTWALVLALLVGLITVVSLVESSRTLVAHATGLQVALMLAACTALEYAHLLFPVTVLIALGVVGTAMARAGELAGLQAQGATVWAVARPFVLLAFILTGAAMLLAEQVLPRAATARRQLMAQELGRIDAATLYFQTRSIWHSDGPWLVYLPELDAEAATFIRPTVYRMEAGRVVQVLRAERLAFDATRGWQLHAGTVYALKRASTQPFASMDLPLTASPASLMQHMGNPRELRGRAARALIARRRQGGLDTTLHHIELLQRRAYPWSAPLLLLAALPWALQPERRRALGGMLMASVACIAYLMVGSQVARLLALAHRLSPAVGATAPLWLGASLVGLSFAVYRRRQNSP